MEPKNRKQITEFKNKFVSILLFIRVLMPWW